VLLSPLGVRSDEFRHRHAEGQEPTMLELTLLRVRALIHRASRGQALVEYSLIMCLVVVVVLIMVIVLGNQVRNTYCNIMGSVASPGS
jgi:Flp pilus assembly pilin Flp